MTRPDRGRSGCPGPTGSTTSFCEVRPGLVIAARNRSLALCNAAFRQLDESEPRQGLLPLSVEPRASLGSGVPTLPKVRARLRGRVQAVVLAGRGAEDAVDAVAVQQRDHRLRRFVGQQSGESSPHPPPETAA